MNPYDIEEDYGRAAFDVRHRVFVGGTWTLPRGFAISPFVVANSGAPFNITLGQDVYGTGIFNARPAFVPAGASGLQVESDGALSIPCPLPASPFRQTTVPAPANSRRTCASARRLASEKSLRVLSRSGGGPGGWGAVGRLRWWARRPRAEWRRGWAVSSAREARNTRYSLTFSANARNVFNNVNLGTPIGVVGSPLFGRSNWLVGGFFSSPAANRRIDFQVMFNF